MPAAVATALVQTDQLGAASDAALAAQELTVLLHHVAYALVVPALRAPQAAETEAPVDTSAEGD